MKPLIFEGAATALVTPFDENDRLNLPMLGQLIEQQKKNGAAAVVLCATTGESPVLSDSEYETAIRFSVKKINGAIPVIAGAGSNNTARSAERTQIAKEAGADAVLTVTPYYNKTTQKGLIEHYTYIADRTDIPIILYNVPSRTGVNIEPETYYELAKHPNIVAVKEANGNLPAIIKTMRLCQDNLTIYSGDDAIIQPVMAIGGKGVISVAGNLIPQKIVRLCQYMKENRTKEAAKLQLSISSLIETLFMETNPIPVKKALELSGYPVGKCRLPLSEAEKKTVDALKKELKNQE